MKGILKNKAVWGYLSLAVFAVSLTLMPDVALAQSNAMKSNVGGLLRNPLFKNSVDIGLLLLAGWRWFEYFSGFQPDNAFKQIIVPAVITFLAFQWTDVLGWVGLI